MTIAGSGGGSLPSLAGTGLPPSPDEERDAIAAMLRHDDAIGARHGDCRYLISHTWWCQWKNYVGFSLSDGGNSINPPDVTVRPGEIDNSKLVLDENTGNSSNCELRKNLEEGQDYDLVPEDVWKKLHEWYKGGPELSRKVVADSLDSLNYIVEVYPLCLQLLDARDKSRRAIKISRKATVHELYTMVCKILDIQIDRTRIWDNFQGSKQSQLREFGRRLEETNLFMDQEILVEVEPDKQLPSDLSINSTGSELALVPIDPSTSSISIAGGPTYSNGLSNGFSTHSGSILSSATQDLEDGYGMPNLNGKIDGQGLTGLHNLGNTCFMNSAIQCLAHTAPLMKYFLDDSSHYSKEINTENPLGLQGELATAFGELLRKLWSAGRSVVAPRPFKAKLSRFAPQFSGYNQHDSHELLAFLLDGLHEDLNRVKRKPYIEAKDADGRPDEEFAEECWKYHKARNDSIIVDLFQGQYKSTLVCPVCSKVSVTFDPFMYLSLPLPTTSTRMMTVTVFSGNGDGLPMPYTVTVLKSGNCKDLIKALSAACCLQDSESLFLVEVYDHRIFRYLKPNDSLSGIKDEDQLVAYKLPAGDNFVRLEILHKRAKGRSSESLFVHGKLVGTPLMTSIPCNSPSKAEIIAGVSAVLAPFVRVKSFSSCQSTSKVDANAPSLDSIVLTDTDCKNEENSGPKMDTEINDENPDAISVDMDISEECGLQLSLTDEKGSNITPLKEESNTINFGFMRLRMDWAERDEERYNFSYLDDLPDVFKHGFFSKKTKQEAVTLFSCVEAFLKEEPLGPDDMWYCPKCKEHRQATKKLDLWRMPEILVVHLKRFQYNRWMKTKLDTFVNFSVRNLDLSKYLNHRISDEPFPVYELFAVSNHYGGLGGGHYTAFAKLVDEDSWYHFDDSHVSRVREEDVKTSAAYLLLYKRVGDSPMREASKSVDSVDCLDSEDL